MALIMWRVLGKGTYGTVFLVASTDLDAPPIAVKSCLLHRSSSLRGLPRIVQWFGSTTSIKNGVQYYDLLLKYAAGGTLADVIQKGKGLQEEDVRCYTRMILRGLCSMHSFGMVDCDLKTSNTHITQRR
ncbi:MAP kinase kinase kinase SSK2 [Morella rubra]|uniref:MAP kinase kinase kinase SSK2 n=1 Tax=Morella rubra TaxID=262757 RepID=A0A6A1VK82_9ROSI|nr:MAP kinase kinase kinase SSK2 [Morella rubra]KAB1216269.1 MAP kinase kinase kinase SSK2 [Morella rubra]KAB1216270.1 MAP kinase kinase kinase SSK2 [Morella rubra]